MARKKAQVRTGTRYTPEFWDAVREFWEASPQVSLDDVGKRVAERFQVKPPNRATISRRKATENWARYSESCTGMSATELEKEIKNNATELKQKLNIGKTDSEENNNKNQDDEPSATTSATTSATSECNNGESATNCEPTEEQQRRIDKVLGGGKIDDKGEWVDVTDIYDHVKDSIGKKPKKPKQEKKKQGDNQTEVSAPDELTKEELEEIQEAQVMLRCASLLDMSEFVPLSKRNAKNQLTASKVVQINRNLIHDVKEGTDLLQVATKEVAIRVITCTDQVEMKILSKKLRALSELKEIYSGLSMQTTALIREDRVYWALGELQLQDREEQEAQRTLDMKDSEEVLEAKALAMKEKALAHQRKMEHLMAQQKASNLVTLEYRDQGLDDDEGSMPIEEE